MRKHSKKPFLLFHDMVSGFGMHDGRISVRCVQCPMILLRNVVALVTWNKPRQNKAHEYKSCQEYGKDDTQNGRFIECRPEEAFPKYAQWQCWWRPSLTLLFRVCDSLNAARILTQVVGERMNVRSSRLLEESSQRHMIFKLHSSDATWKTFACRHCLVSADINGF